MKGKGVPPETNVEVMGVARDTRDALIDTTGELSVNALKGGLIVGYVAS